MGEMDGQVALVTGGASGLGKTLVERFLQEGDRVSTTVGDVTLLADNRRAVADTVGRFGRLDCFIGNAGV
ncbi:MAG TPA: 3-(cis-5,6-dihydroxycyclohexa-1,3-dien-1-yl)propanoate dehydrogenase, partial [Candidatus Binataceae bacterium]|nr:3-(cis-5,6-dihydroxycyclohexa-1,3-dien-1-yl)propanoate dehydrogenase [Candidatus Binataceae bacterium]